MKPATIISLETDGRKWRTVAGNGRITAVGIRKSAHEQDEPSYTDPQGRTRYPYAAEFRSADGTFSVELWGMGEEHAEQQLKALRDTAAITGRILASGTL